jgi:hypothetical protein
MKPPCVGRGCRPAPSEGRQQFVLLVDLDAHPMLEVAAARVLLIALEDLRSEGIVICHARLELNGRAGHGQWTLQ